jgi:hypothetical protein
MPLFDRFRYALYAAAVGAAALGLVIALLSADAIGVLPTKAFDWIMSPWYMAVIYAVAFALSPILARRFPITRRERPDA